jgi:cell division initiation protein
MNQNQLLKELFGNEPTITPEDMYAKKFRKRLGGGYRPREVDEYLRRSADLMESLLKRVQKLLQEAQGQQREIAEYRQQEQSLREAVVSAQRFAQDTLETARSKADAMVTEARLQKERLLLEAEQLPVTLLAEVRRLREQRNRLREELTGILEVHTSLLQRRPAAMQKLPQEEALELEPPHAYNQEPFTNEEDVQE